ncbi:MAG: hypothetical protein A4E67_00132 [Syntrophaceae bacterium PtaB.Bin038]|nr:MAG: hypothetical protein A4E67_00132 [Syntrophaceae bacterium PtaB.Bin038]
MALETFTAKPSSASLSTSHWRDRSSWRTKISPVSSTSGVSSGRRSSSIRPSASAAPSSVSSISRASQPRSRTCSIRDHCARNTSMASGLRAAQASSIE